MIDFNTASEIIRGSLKPLQQHREFRDIIETTGSIIAESVISLLPLPPFDNSAMDGFAVKYNPNIRSWSIAGEISAGNYTPAAVSDISAVEIMTGARLPENADTVIPVEDVIIREENVILNTGAKYVKGMNVRRKGEDLEKNSLAIKSDTLLKPQHIALAASCGRSKLFVYKKLRIGVITTGDELVEIYQEPANDQIRASNLYALCSAVREMNHIPINLGIVRDNKAAIQERISRALDGEIDILITTGGVSAGKYDLVTEILPELGVDIKFHKVNIKPGKPVLFGVYKDNEKEVPVFGLPGNPVSSLVAFYLFIKDNLLKTFGQEGLPVTTAILAKDINKEDSKRHFIRGILSRTESGDIIVKPAGKQSSGNLAQMSTANCLVVIPEDKINPKIGEIVECIMM